VYYFETKYKNGYDWMKQMKFKKKVICVSCGSSFFVVITDDYKVYTWGLNNSGQLGNSTCTDDFIKELHEVKFSHKIGNFSFSECISKDLWIPSKRKWIGMVFWWFCSCQIQILIFWIHFYPIKVSKFLGIKTKRFFSISKKYADH